VPADADVTLEERADDVRAVLDAAGVRRTALLATHDGGAVALFLAAQHPARVLALVLYNTWARLAQADDHPWGADPDLLVAGRRMYTDQWGTGATLDLLAPSVAGDPTMRRAWARHEQATSSLGQTHTTLRLAMELDARHLLGAVHVPTLVLHTTGNLIAPVEHGRHLASSIPGAEFVELPGSDHVLMVGDSGALLREVERFLVGAPTALSADRVLATVMFTDIVGSTARLASAGDREWRRLLDRHHDFVRSELARHRGREVQTTGDGFLALFDGPARAVRCARAITEGMPDLGLRVRVGLHCGECEVTQNDIAGIAVHTAARVAALAGPDEVLVTRTVKDLVAGSGLTFDERGEHELKGVPDRWALYAVVADDAVVGAR
jgi:class 3 adenylate cyclase